MGKFPLFTVSTVLVLTISALCSLSSFAQERRTFDSRQIAPVQSGKPSLAVERIKQGIQFLEQELKVPSDSSWGVGGGPIDSGYIQGVMVGVLQFPGSQSPDTLKQCWRDAEDKRVKELLAIPLAAIGDREMIPTMIRLATGDKEGSIRMEAILALRAFLLPRDKYDVPQKVLTPDPWRPLDKKTAGAIIETFMTCLQDPFKRYYGTVKSEGAIYYPVQEQTEISLKSIGLRVMRGTTTLLLMDKKGAIVRTIPRKQEPKPLPKE